MKKMNFNTNHMLVLGEQSPNATQSDQADPCRSHPTLVDLLLLLLLLPVVLCFLFFWLWSSGRLMASHPVLEALRHSGDLPETEERAGIGGLHVRPWVHQALVLQERQNLSDRDVWEKKDKQREIL